MKFITLETLQYFKTKLDGLFVSKEKKTGSDTEYKVLSDNNLTDELVSKINAAGAATEVTEEIATAKSEAIAESKSYTDTAKAAAIADANAYTDTAKAAAIDTAKSYTDTAKSEAVSSAKSYTDTEVATAKTAAIADAKTYTDTEVASAKTALEATINTKISTAYKVKGSTAFAGLPTLSEAEEGNVYNLNDAFTTTADFVEGAGKKYPAGSNIVCVEESEGVFKWDVIAGFIDTDTFVKNSDIENVSTTEIDALFAA